MFYNYLNNHEIYSHACNPNHFCDYPEPIEVYDPFHYEDAGKTILTGADKDFLVGEVTLPSSVKTIKQYAFYAHTSNDWSVVIPDSVETIEEGAFRNSRLQHVTFGNSLKNIGKWAFAYNTYCSFTSLPATVESIGEESFASCLYKNPTFTIPGSVTFIGAKVFGSDNYYHPSSVTIESGVTEIGDNVFENLYTDSLSLPDSLIKIGNSAFKSAFCGNLVIPDSVTTIEESAFMYYKGTNIVLSNALTEIKDDVFFNSNLLTIVIPTNVSSIGSEAFAVCKLSAITIGSSVTSIGDDAFYGCKFNKSAFINNSSAEGYPWGATIIDDTSESAE